MLHTEKHNLDSRFEKIVIADRGIIIIAISRKRKNRYSTILKYFQRKLVEQHTCFDKQMR